jgi:hypothetical protein
MNEAAGLFESISNSRWFSNSSVILFLNKTDLFKAKLISSPIYEYYSDYEGESDYETAVAYMESKFRPLYRNGANHPLICHQTCATDSDQLKVVFDAVEQSILAASMAESVSHKPCTTAAALTLTPLSLIRDYSKTNEPSHRHLSSFILSFRSHILHFSQSSLAPLLSFTLVATVLYW